MFRNSTNAGDQLKFDEEMGPEMKPSEKASRAAKALAELNKGDDKLTRKSEEQVNKVFIFCRPFIYFLKWHIEKSLESCNFISLVFMFYLIKQI